jgi:sugar phosphate permease
MLTVLGYAIGLYFSGFLCSKFHLQRLLATGILGTAIIFGCIGLDGLLTHFQSAALISFLSFTNGLFQSTVLPCCVTILGTWFLGAKHGLLMVINTSMIR